MFVIHVFFKFFQWFDIDIHRNIFVEIISISVTSNIKYLNWSNEFPYFSVGSTTLLKALFPVRSTWPGFSMIIFRFDFGFEIWKFIRTMKQSAIPIDSSRNQCFEAIDRTSKFNWNRQNWKVTSYKTTNERNKKQTLIYNIFGHKTEKWIATCFFFFFASSWWSDQLQRFDKNFDETKTMNFREGKEPTKIDFYFIFSNCSSKLIFITIFG